MMALFDWLNRIPTDMFTLSFVLIIGLCVGSFLNVVIYRIPKRMDDMLKVQAYEILELIPPQTLSTENIARQSACRHCHTPLKAWHNIPLISYALLRGRCQYCKTPISIQYPLVELTAGLSVFLTCWFFGINAIGLSLSLLWLAFIALAMIDFRHFLLPDELTLPLVWIGLLINIFALYTPLVNAVIGAVVGYIALWIVYWLFKLLTGKEGMGYGDFKLTAVAGAWFGIESLLFVIFASAIIGIIISLSASMIKRKAVTTIPYGPAIILATVVYAFCGEMIIQDYWIWIIGN